MGRSRLSGAVRVPRYLFLGAVLLLSLLCLVCDGHSSKSLPIENKEMGRIDCLVYNAVNAIFKTWD
jgi:hypothetical protein